MAHALERRNRTFTAGSVGKDLRARKYGTFGNFDVLTIRRGIRLLKVRGEIEGQGSHNLVISSPVRVPHDIAVVTDEDYCEDCGGYREMEVLCEKYPGGRHWRAVVECGVCGDGYNTLYDNDFVRKYVAATT